MSDHESDREDLLAKMAKQRQQLPDKIKRLERTADAVRFLCVWFLEHLHFSFLHIFAE